MRLFFPGVLLFILAGCFWESYSPDFDNKDKPGELVVIWDQVVANNTIERSSWVTSHSEKLKKLTRHLDTQSWQSSTVLPACHSTRIILRMNSGKVWEICQSIGKTKTFKIFDRQDHGWSGWISWSDAFLLELASMIEAEKNISIDLSKEYRTEIRLGELQKVVPHSTQELLKKYPGYPEIIWNKNKEKFEYAK
ncbi:MAG: hypothetical protein ACRBHB_04460 [Arenicella sp.]